MTAPRSKIIDLGGVRVAPEAIEEVLPRQPGVKAAAAFGSERKDGVRRAAVAVVFRDGFDPSQIGAALASAMPQIKVEVVVVSTVTRSQRGKVVRSKLTSLYGP